MQRQENVVEQTVVSVTLLAHVQQWTKKSAIAMCLPLMPKYLVPPKLSTYNPKYLVVRNIPLTLRHAEANLQKQTIQNWKRCISFAINPLEVFHTLSSSFISAVHLVQFSKTESKRGLLINLMKAREIHRDFALIFNVPIHNCKSQLLY